MKLPSFLQSAPPDVAIELATRRVTAVAVAREGDSVTVRASASVPLDEGVLVPVLTGPVVTQADALAAALTRAVEAVGGARRVALAVPDGLAKVSLVRFETLPADHDELEQLVRWQVRKTAPFPVEQAQISWTPGATLDGGRELVVALARREGIVQIESACQRARVEPGLVDLASFHLANLMLARQSTQDAHDWLVVHLGDAGSTLMLLRGAALVFYRHRPVEEQTSLGDLVHQTAMYYEDRLAGRGLGRVVVVDDTDAGDSAAIEEIERRLGMRAEAFALPSWVRFSDRAVAGSAARLGAPLGALVREG